MKTKKRHIVIISPEYPTYTNWGGVATHNKNIARLYRDMGHTVTVITHIPDGKTVRVTHDEGIVIHALPLRLNNRILHILIYKILCAPIRCIARATIPLTFFSLEWNIVSLLYFRSLIQRRVVDLIHAPDYHFPTLFISHFFRNIPLIINVQGPQYMYDKYEQRSTDRKIKGWIEHFYVHRFAKKIIACSKNIKDRILTDEPDLSTRVQHIPNFLYQIPKPDPTPISTNTIVYWGRMEYRKGTDALLRSFIRMAKRNPHLSLILIGEFVDYFTTEKPYASLDDVLTDWRVPENIRRRVFAYPRIDSHDVLTRVLSTMKGIAVFPSRFEPFGYVTIEAMSMGFVTVASMCGGGKEIITPEHDGYLCNPTERSITSCITHVRTLSPSRIRRVVANARKTVTRTYGPKHAMRAFSSLVEEVVTDARHIQT